MDPFSIATGGGGLSGGTSSASGDIKATNTFGGFGASTYNFGSGSISTPNWWVIGGLVVAGLIALKMFKK
jgi:hypothetical protein